MKLFDDFFTTQTILACLCRERLSVRMRIHESQYLTNLAPHERERADLSKKDIFEYFPSRSKWFRAPKEKRLNNSYGDHLASLMITIR